MLHATVRSSRVGRGLLALVAVCLPTLVVVAADVASTAPTASAGESAVVFPFIQLQNSTASCSNSTTAAQNFANLVASSAAPSNVVGVRITLTGGGGAGGDDRLNSSIGGAGGRASVVSGTFPISSGQVVWVRLGCGGVNGPPSWAVSTGGFGRGGPARDYYGGGGGGASMLCVGNASGCSAGTDTVRAVAGGGGGGGRSANDGCSASSNNYYNGGAGGSGTTGSETAFAGGFGRAGSGGTGIAANNNFPSGGGGGSATNGGGGAGTDMWGSDAGQSGASSTITSTFINPTAGGNGGRGARGYDETNAGGGGGGLAGGGGGGGGDSADGCGNQHAGGAGGGAGSSWLDDSVTGRTFDVAAGTVTNSCDTGSPYVTLNASTAGYGGTQGYGGCHGYATATWITNDAPTGSAQTAASATKGTALGITLGNSDPDGDARTCSIVTAPTKGSVALSGGSPSTNCSASYTASANQTGNDTFTYKVTDPRGLTSANYTVTVPIGNRKPVGTAASQTIQRGNSASVNLAASDADGDTIDGTLANTGRTVVSTASMPSGSTVSCNVAGSCTVAIAANTTPGSYSYTWKATDLVEASDNVTQTVVVANNAPTATARTVNNVQRGRPASDAAFTVTGSDPANSDTLSYAVASTAGMPAGSSVACSTAGACLVAVPADTAPGNYSFTFTASDNAATSSTATVTVGVANTAPVANPVGTLSTTVGAALPVTLDGTDFNGDTLTYNAPITPPTKGSVSGTGASRSYTAANGTKGADSFTYTVSDNGPSTSTAGTVSIFIDNTAPTADAQSVTVDAPAAKAFQLTGSDVNADTLTYFLQSTPSKGDVSCDAAGACTYTPHAAAVGSDTLDFVAFDGTANSTVQTITFDVIPPAPTITGSRSPLANGAGWNNEPVTVSFSCQSDALASCTSPVTLSTDGADQSVTGTAKDTLDREADTTVSGISIDQVAPTLVGLATTAPNAAGWYRTPVSMAWSCDDTLSGVAPADCPAPSSTVGEGGAVTVQGSTTDRAGNQASVASQAVKVDLTKPSTSVSSPPTWSNADVTLTLTALDALSGVASTSYAIDGGATATGTSPVVSGQGTHTVEYWSTDAAGNEENHQTVQVRIDVQAPSITGSVDPEPNGAGWNNEPVTVTFDCGDSDEGSGVASCTPSQDFDDETDTSVTGTVTDDAGNSATVQVPVRIDLTSPTVTAQVPSPNSYGWYNAPAQVSFSCADAGGSGVAVCPAPVVYGGEGAGQPVLAEAVDAAGNTGSASGSTVSIDRTAPTISGASVQPANLNGTYDGNVTVRWTCDDTLSGVISCPADQEVSGEGVYVINGSVSDRAGNISTSQVTIQINHDTSKDPGMVHGTITDRATGSPVAGATVTLRTTAGAVLSSTTSGTDGTYTFAPVADGSYKLHAVRSGAYQGSYFPNAANASSGQVIAVEVGVNAAADVTLASTLTLSGTVRNSSGDPIAGATVRLAPGAQAAITNAAGYYQIPGLLPGQHTVSAFAYGYNPTGGSTITLSADRVLDRNLTTAATGHGAKGTVTIASSGGALPGAQVTIWPKDSAVGALTVTTGADGRYSVASLPAGSYEVQATRADYQTRWAADSLSRSGASSYPVTTGCTSSPVGAWGDPCAVSANVAMRR